MPSDPHKLEAEEGPQIAEWAKKRELVQLYGEHENKIIVK